ncbi:MAG: exo-alpha-sialidase, partial [Oscillospiraceae bacterium]|nr:exo-alpha-sialidase [Oscillospiraceae bacterium]
MQKMKRFVSLAVTVCMLLSILATGVFAVSISEKPENGTTKGQPFAAGTGGSQNFRIPGIVTLNDGTVVAVCDARWNHSADSSGLDTIVSVSKDNGENWEYTFANYLGDNGNVFNSYSSCIIDPAIATDGTTIYLIADLFPAGMAINTSAYRAQRGSTGYTAEGYLALRSDEENGLTFGQSSYDTYAASATYGYYLKDGKIYTTAGAQVEGYEVDAYFNITGNGVSTNLFFGDSPYKPFPTDYLYMTTSTDGLNWSEPTLINLKAADEQTLLIGPGNGTYDPTTGRMVFTAYEYDWGTQNACLVWRETDGTWHRSENAASSSHWTSEASSVVLDDGTVRIFYRDGYTNLFYSDYVYSEAQGNYVVSNREVSTAAVKASNNQLTSIRYSKPVNGKDAILVACSASGSGSRVNGHLYVFTLNEDNTMDLAYDYDIFPGEDEAYAYNCISELNNGDIALLYESASAAITYHVIDMDEVLDRENDPSLSFKAFELLTGDVKTFTDNSGYYGDADISELDTNVATLTMTGEEIVTDAAQLGSNATYSGDVIDLENCLYTFAANDDGTWVATSTDADGNTVYLYPGHTASSGYPNAESSNVPLQIFEGYEEGTFYLYTATSDNTNGSASYLYFDRSGLRWDRVSSFNNREDWMINCSLRLYKPVEGAGSAEIPGYERVTELSAITDGEYLVVGPGSDGNLYALYPNTSTANRYCQLAKLLGRTTVGHTELTFTGVGAGYTEVQVGSIVYQITVADVTEVPVEISVGTSATFTEPNGNYADADTSALDTSVATVTLKGIDGTADNGLSLAPVSTLADGTYVILNTRANKLVTNAPATAAAAAGAGSGLNMDGTIRDEVADIAIWTITAVDGGYTLQDQDGNYMTIGSTTAGVTETSTTLTLNWRGSSWTIAKDGAYLNHFGGGSSTCAAGWQDGSAAGDAGSQFALYSYSEEPVSASTEVTFTGVAPGSTALTIGRTKFLVTVAGAVHDVQLEVGETASYVVAGDQTGADVSALDTDVATVDLSLTTVAHVSNGTGYDAEFVELDDCLYTFTATADGYYEVSATAADGTTVYLNHYSSGNNNPSITTPGKIDVQTSSHTNMFKLVAQIVEGGSGATRGLHFHAEAAMPYWNRCGNDTSTRCHEYLYRPVREGEQSSAEIDGYVLVTDIAEVVDGGQYLIVHNSEVDDDLYILHPTASTDKWPHVAKLAPATKVTFTGVAAGETALTLPGNSFEITVTGEAPHEHSWSDWTVTTEPTCTEAGVETRTCECGETETREVAALGHTEAEAVRENEVAATCTTAGSYDSVVYCSECGEEISRETFTI